MPTAPWCVTNLLNGTKRAGGATLAPKNGLTLVTSVPSNASASIDHHQIHPQKNLDAPLAGRVEVDHVHSNGPEPRAFRLQPRRRRLASPATPISASALGEGTALTTKVTDQSSLVGLVSWAQKV